MRVATRLEAAALTCEKNNALLLPLAVTTLGMVCAWKICSRCLLRVHPSCVTVVYETRRNSILSSSMDKGHKASDELPQISHFRPAMYVIGMLLYRSKSLVVVPPSSFFSTFTLPRTVLDEQGDGEAVDCTVEGIHVTDGEMRMVLTLRYCIPFDQLERYLAAVGPAPPNERIAVAAAAVAKARGAELSVGLILNRSRRDAVFLAPFREHLSSKLMSEAAVKLIDATVESVEIAERQGST
ncbi:hypothetical protein DQ04_04101030 [Trypanosoma grayi]|uniref:hypothetical protein n=1 Tax=Trypanosoma grayi TaxID=71804 RepID=UPI0004F4819B|nr:hypothetical protein DQ04_04101030 [Trypanosoma grayi]KEG10160.1 hypothetical protein DQ04_04101030 [Trypanosoma grayi]